MSKKPHYNETIKYHDHTGLEEEKALTALCPAMPMRETRERAAQ